MCAIETNVSIILTFVLRSTLSRRPAAPAAPITRPGWGRLALAGLLSGLAAGLINTVLYSAARWLGAMPQDVGVGPAALPMTVLPIVSLGLVSAVAGAVLFDVLLRVARRPVRALAWISGLVLLSAAIPPFRISGAPIGMIVALQVMHLVAAATVLGALLRLRRPRRKT